LNAGIDPDHETEVYSKYHHYSLDYSKTTPGTEWSLKGFTVKRFKYPNDPRVDQNTDVGSRSLGAGAYRIGGKLFVARSNQEGYRWELYRQEPATEVTHGNKERSGINCSVSARAIHTSLSPVT
jgi:hypothetical protein